MMKQLSAAVLTGALVVGAPAVAIAQTGTPAAGSVRRADAVKARAHAAIERRLQTLERLASRVRESRPLSDAHRGALGELIESQKTGLTALDAKIQADSDPEALRADVRSIVVDYRVYLLTVPKVHLVLCADAELAAATKLDEVAARLQTKVDEAAAAGKDVSTAQGHLDAMKAKLGDARAAASGVADSVLPLVPQDHPDNQPTLDAARTSVRTGRAALREARELARQVVTDLRAG